MKHLYLFEQFNIFPNSKMREVNGTLTTFYHGVGNQGKFKEFDERRIGTTSGNYGHYGKGFYFTDSKGYAKAFSRMYGGTEEVIEAYLDIKNPFIVNEKNLIYVGVKYDLKLPNKKAIAIDIKDLLKQLKPIDEVAYRLLYSLDSLGYKKGWKEFLKNNNADDTNIDLNTIGDWYEVTLRDKYDSGVSDYYIDELKNIGINPKLIYDYEENLNMAYLTNLGENSEGWTDAIKEEGYDGIVAGEEIVVFNNSQIYIID